MNDQIGDRLERLHRQSPRRGDGMKRPVAAITALEEVFSSRDDESRFRRIGIETSTSGSWREAESPSAASRRTRHVPARWHGCIAQSNASRRCHPGEIDVIVLSTRLPTGSFRDTVDNPGGAGGNACAAFDIGAACAGWLYAMTTAEGS